MKRMLLVLAAIVFVGFGVGNAQPEPFQITAVITHIGEPGSAVVNGNELLVRDLLVTTDVSGDVTGTDVHNYNLNRNLVTGVGQTFGTFTIEATGGLCVGTFEGHFAGQSVNGSFEDQDSGTFTMHGSGGCQGIHVNGTFNEPVDQTFVLTGEVTP